MVRNGEEGGGELDPKGVETRCASKEEAVDILPLSLPLLGRKQPPFGVSADNIDGQICRRNHLN